MTAKTYPASLPGKADHIPVLRAVSIKSLARSLGFSACGIAKADAVEESIARRYRRWLENGEEASMSYMANYLEKRLDPRLLVPGVRSIVSLALNYAPSQLLPKGEYQFAAYALGKDYHDLMKERMRQLAGKIKELHPLFPFLPRKEAHATFPPSQQGSLPIRRQAMPASSVEDPSQTSRPCTASSPPAPQREPGWGCFCDTAPVLERYWAQKAGLGWVGRNHQLIIPHAGSMFFLGEIFLPFEVDVYDESMPDRCGKCHRCVDACPTRAIVPGEDFHASRCLSYQLIENRGELSEEAKAAMGDTIYGCDRCQTACPWNRFATPSTEPELQPKPELLSMSKEKWHRLTVEDYRRLFKGSAVKRAKFDGLKRNIQAKEQ